MDLSAFNTDGNALRRSRLLEVMSGQIHNRMYGIGDHALADKYMPDIFAFTEADLFECQDMNTLPADWKAYAEACIKEYDL